MSTEYGRLDVEMPWKLFQRKKTASDSSTRNGQSGFMRTIGRRSGAVCRHVSILATGRISPRQWNARPGSRGRFTARLGHHSRRVLSTPMPIVYGGRHGFQLPVSLASISSGLSVAMAFANSCSEARGAAPWCALAEQPGVFNPRCRFACTDAQKLQVHLVKQRLVVGVQRHRADGRDRKPPAVYAAEAPRCEQRIDAQFLILPDVIIAERPDAAFELM